MEDIASNSPISDNNNNSNGDEDAIKNADDASEQQSVQVTTTIVETAEVAEVTEVTNVTEVTEVSTESSGTADADHQQEVVELTSEGQILYTEVIHTDTSVSNEEHGATEVEKQNGFEQDQINEIPAPFSAVEVDYDETEEVTRQAYEEESTESNLIVSESKEQKQDGDFHNAQDELRESNDIVEESEVEASAEIVGYSAAPAEINGEQTAQSTGAEVASYSVGTTPSNATDETDNALTRQDSRKDSTTSSGKFVLRNARQPGAEHFIQHIRNAAAALMNNPSELEKGEILTILRSTSKEEQEQAPTQRPSRQSIVTNDLVQQFEKASVGGVVPLPNARPSVTAMTRAISTEQQQPDREGSSLAASRNASQSSITSSDFLESFEGSSSKVEFVALRRTESNGSSGVSVPVTKTNEMLAKELEEKMKARELILEKEKLKLEVSRAQGEEVQARFGAKAMSPTSASNNGLPQWQIDLLEKKRKQREMTGATSPISPVSPAAQKSLQ